jgi:hypothetical protein
MQRELNHFLTVRLASRLESEGRKRPRRPRADVLPPRAVACHYETSEVHLSHRPSGRAREWYFWREPARIEARSADGDRGEIWLRRTGGEIVLHEIDCRAPAVETYAASELRRLGRDADWDRLAHLVAPAVTERLLSGGRAELYAGRPARRVRAEWSGIEVEVVWLVVEALPASILEVYPDRVLRLVLKSIWPIDAAPWDRLETPVKPFRKREAAGGAQQRPSRASACV